MNDEERTELVKLLPDPARHDLSGHRHRTLRERFMQQINEVPDNAAPAARPRKRQRVLVAVGASLTAIVVALGSVSVFGFGVGKFWAGQTEAGQLLGQIALVASTSTDIPPADQVRDDQFVYIESYGGSSSLHSGTGEVHRQEPHRRRIWLSVDGSRPGLLHSRPGRSTDISIEDQPYIQTFRYLTTLPTNPDLLLAKIYIENGDAGPNPQQEAFVVIGDLMRQSVVPPDLAKAFYQAAARIPGITVIHDAEDALGRRGIAIGREHGGDRREWIFDRNTYQFLVSEPS